MGQITKKFQAEMLRRISFMGLIAFALTPFAAYAAIGVSANAINPMK
jgi:hypothetical protein